MTSEYRNMNESNNETSDFQSWDAERLGVFFRKKGLGQYCEVLEKHKITGRLAPLLNDNDLKEMGIDVVGDRLMFKHHLKDISRRERFNKRVETLWEGEERVFFSHWDKNCFTMGGCCPIDPSTYKLTRNHLKVKTVAPVRCGPIRLCCFGASYVNNNIDLSKVDDVDVLSVPAPCWQHTCLCANGKDHVEVSSRFEKGGKLSMTLEQGKGEAVANLILNQVEESQKMERN